MTQTVYLVLCRDGGPVVAVFSTPAKAQAYLDHYNRIVEYGRSLVVRPFVVDLERRDDDH